jgi:uncharacterized protein
MMSRKDADSRIIYVDKKEKFHLEKPTVCAGFLDAGLIAPAVLDYIVKQLGLHQIAFIESRYIMPGAVFVGKQFRHPCRIHANKKGSLCILICEAPILFHSVQSVTESIACWCTSLKAKELIVVSGLLQESFEVGVEIDWHKRQAYLLENYSVLATNADKEGIKHKTKGRESSSPQETSPRLSMETIKINDTEVKVFRPSIAIVAGIAGDLLASCAARKMKCKSILVPSCGAGIDPEGALLMIEVLNRLVPELKIDTSLFKKQAEMIRNGLEESMKSRLDQLKQYDAIGRRDVDRIYR